MKLPKLSLLSKIHSTLPRTSTLTEDTSDLYGEVVGRENPFVAFISIVGMIGEQVGEDAGDADDMRHKVVRFGI